MKEIKYKIRNASLLAIFLAMVACEPQMQDKPQVGNPPTAEELDFTITQGNTDFKFVMTNTSSVTGIASWDLGNGSKSSDATATGNYPLPGTYTITMTLVSRGGVATKSKTLTTTKTDYSIFTDSKFIYLSGGTGVPGGKTWALDSLATGHLGVGPAGTNGLAWWASAPLAKKGVKVMYDDLINFKITGFAATYTNHGKSYVKDFRRTDPAYSNAVQNDVDYVVDFVPAAGTWFIETTGGKNYLTLSSTKPIFPCFDVGATGGKYEILKIEENLLELVAAGSDGNAWHYQLIPQGYVKPTITYTVNATEGTDNDVACSVTDYSIPAGQSVTNITWNFGDGTPEVTTANKDDVTHHTFMRAGTFTVTAKLNTSLGTLTGTKSVTLANNNSGYVPFQLDAIVMYNDFSEVIAIPAVGQDGSLTIVDNPSKVYPNKSLKVAKFTKTDQQWANAFFLLSPGYRYDLRLKHSFFIKAYGKAGDEVLLKLENTDKGGNAWQTGTYDVKFTITADNKWQIFEYNFSGVGAGWDWTGDIFTSDIVTDSRFNHGFYNVIRIMVNPGNGTGTHTVYLDDISGPHVEGITK